MAGKVAVSYNWLPLKNHNDICLCRKGLTRKTHQGRLRLTFVFAMMLVLRMSITSMFVTLHTLMISMATTMTVTMRVAVHTLMISMVTTMTVTMRVT